MKKKVVAGLLAASMVMSMAACGGNDSDAGSKADSTSSKPQTSSESSAEKVEAKKVGETEYFKLDLYEEGTNFFPLSDDVTVKIAAMRDDSRYATGDRVFYKEMLEATNLNVEWIDWPTSQFTEKLNLTFASGELPDAMMGNFILTAAEIVKYGSEGWLLTWNDYINEEYMPNLYALCQECDGLLESITAPDGNIYGLPQFDMNGLSTTNDTLVINTEWLEKVGMEMPTTTEEFYQVLKAFKEAGDLNGNGKDDEIPFTFNFNQANNGWLSFMGFTGIAYNNQHDRLCFKDGELVYVPQEEEFKEFLTYMHKLYSEGLVDLECFTMTAAAYTAKVQTSEPTCGVISIWDAARVNAPIEGNDATKEGVYQYLAPISGENGADPVWVRRYTPYNNTFCFVVSADTDYAEELVRWADLHYATDISIQNSKGVEGLYIEEIGDGVYQTIKKEDGSSYTTVEMTEYIASIDGIYGLAEGEYSTNSEYSPQSKDAANALYEEYLNPNHVYKHALMTEEEAELDSLLKQPLKDYVDQWAAEFVTNGKIEERWDDYVAGLQALDVDQFIELYKGINARSKVN